MKHPYDFRNLQCFLSKRFAGNSRINCYAFETAGKSCTEVSFLFLINEVRVFYSIPREDLYASFVPNDSCNIAELVVDFYRMFGGDAEVAAHLSYNDIECPLQHLSEQISSCTNFDGVIIGGLSNEISCSLYASPSTEKEILFVINTYNADIQSVHGVIDKSSESDFISAFFDLIILLYGR